MSIDNKKFQKDNTKAFKSLNCYSNLKKTLSKFNKTTSNYKRQAMRTHRPYKMSNTYYKDPFFLNDDNLNMQLSVLKSLDLFELKNEIESNEDKEFKENTILPCITEGNTERNKSVLKISKNLNFSNTINFNTQNQKLKNVNDLIFYRTVFKGKNVFKKPKTQVVDNKLNMMYAENEEQYNQMVEKENKKLKKLGKPIKNKNVSPIINIKIKDAKNKIKFMKGVLDYSYPAFVLSKIKFMEKRLKNFNYSKNNHLLSPVQIRNYEKSVRNNNRKEYLMNSIIGLKK